VKLESNHGRNEMIWIQLFDFFPNIKFIGRIRLCIEQGTKRKALIVGFEGTAPAEL
jgi:hypothetical protein